MPSKRLAKKGAKTQYRAPALDRGLDILALLTERTEPVGASDIARALGRTKTQIYRMLLVLEHRGYIARDDSDRYKLTERLFDLGMRQAAKRALHEAALPVMGRLSEAALQSCHIGIVSGEDIVVIARVESPGPISFAVRLGYRVPLLELTSGRVVFAFQTPERQAQWLRQLSRGKIVPRRSKC